MTCISRPCMRTTDPPQVYSISPNSSMLGHFQVPLIALRFMPYRLIPGASASVTSILGIFSDPIPVCYSPLTLEQVVVLDKQLTHTIVIRLGLSITPS